MSTVAASAQTTWKGGRSPFNVSYGKLMMWYFLMSDAFTFGAFLISYGLVRFSANSWPDPNIVFKSFPGMGHADLPLVFVSLMTFILIFSSVTMVLAVQAGHRMERSKVTFYMILTIIGGAAFLGCQAWEWNHLYHDGFWFDRIPQSYVDQGFKPNFSNYFFTITGFHGFHVLSGVVINIVMLIKNMRGDFDKRGHYEMIEKAGLYWHFVDLVWVFVFTCFYLF
jgi:cytochrome c oxidase subunit III